MTLAFALLVGVKVSVAVLVAWAGARMLASAGAAARHAVWATGLVVILVLPFLSASSRTVAFVVPGTHSSVVATSPDADPAPAQPMPTMDRAGSSWKQRVLESQDVPWAALAWSIYLSGTLGMLIPFVVGASRAHGIRRRAAPVAVHGEWRGTLQRVDKPGSIARVDVVVSSEVAVPVTFGLLRPVIVLPMDVATWTCDERRVALVHEFAHVARCDWGFQLLGVLACALHWYNPLVPMAVRRLGLEAERACDECVLRLGANPHAYADQLVMLARGGVTADLRSTLAMSRGSCLASRVNTILAYRRSTTKLTMIATAAAVVLTASALLLAPLQPVTAAQYEWVRRVVNLPPLMKSIAQGNVDDVARLIAQGADVDQSVDGRGTPLILAASDGHAEIARMLIEAGADVNRMEQTGSRDLMRTSLAAASRNGHRDIAQLLLDRGAHIDAAPPGDATALMEAAANGHEEIVRLLIERGADVNLDIDGDGNAIIAAARGGNVEIARMIVGAGADVNAGVPGDANALIAAVDAGDRRMVKYLLSQGANPMAYVPGDGTALVVAGEAGDREMLRLLIKAE